MDCSASHTLLTYAVALFVLPLTVIVIHVHLDMSQAMFLLIPIVTTPFQYKK